MHYFDFHYSWEQRKVSELFKVTRGYVLAATLTEPAKTDEMPYPVYSSQTKDNGLMGYYKDYLYEDAITWTTDGANAGTVNYRAGKFYCTNVCGVLLSNEVTANQMIAEALNNVAKGYVSYVGNPKLMNNVMADIEIMIPTHAEEREKLSVFFRNLDNLITLHQREFAFLCKEKSKKFRYIKNAWEQRKFSELVQIERGGSPRPIDDFITDAPNGLNWVKIGDAPTQGNYITKTAEKIRPEGLSKTREVHPGDLILSNSMSFGKPYIMGIDGCIHDGWLLIRNTYGVFDLTFLCHLLGTPQMLSQYRSLAAGSTVNNLNKELVGNTYVTIPSITEQRVLGAYLEQLDNLITLHQRKYDKLTNVKKSMLEKMFPQNGSNVPEIRFKGFTEAWEQRKVTEIGKIYIGLVTTMTKHYTDEGTLLIRNSDIKDGKFEFGDNPIYLEKTFAEKNETRMHQIGDVITVHTGDVGTSAVITENEAKSIGFATIVTRPNPKIIDSNYLCSFLNTDKHKKWAVSISTGDGRTNYNLGDYFELVVPVPSIAEQKKIASYIQKLNRLITLHQRELEKLKNLKKACLEKMFV